MATTVTIYHVPALAATPATDKSVEICSVFAMGNSYVDTAAYEGTVYDTNVEGNGTTVVPEPYATTMVPLPTVLAQISVGTIGEDATYNSLPAKKVEIEVEDAKEVLYYKTVKAQIEDPSIVIEIAEA